jgi:pimeloyl-ACP methyl ester carboxylesterase
MGAVMGRSQVDLSSGATLSYADQGAGDETIVLVHGWTGSLRAWDDIAARLTGEYRVIRPDLRGHGSSPRSRTDYSPVTLGHDVAALMRELDVGPAHLVGHSLGGNVVSAVAVECPHVAKSVIAVDSAYGRPVGHQDKVREWVGWLQADPESERSVALRWGSVEERRRRQAAQDLRDRVGETSPDVVWRTLHDIHLRPDSFSVRPASDVYLTRRRMPVLALTRTRASAEWEKTTLHHPLSRSIVWEDASHYLFADHPERFVTLLRQWVALVAGAPDASFTFGADVV